MLADFAGAKARFYTGLPRRPEGIRVRKPARPLRPKRAATRVVSPSALPACPAGWQI